MRHHRYLLAVATTTATILFLFTTTTTLANPVVVTPHHQAQTPLLSNHPSEHKHHQRSIISPSLFNEFEQLSRIVDISYCIGTPPSPGISEPFICPSHCSSFPSFQLIQSWNTGPLMSDSCGYIALSHPPAEKRIVIAFRGTYSVTNALVDLSTGKQEYVPYPPSKDTSTFSEESVEEEEKGGPKMLLVGGRKCEGCAAHAGFLASWKVAAEIVVPVVEELRGKFEDYRIELVGHSLGGAVAALAGLEFKERGWDCRVTTFGEPRVGNANLSHYINLYLPHPMYRRITHKSDPVPLLPFSKWGFVQHETEYFIEKLDLPVTYEDVRVCEGDEDPECAAGGSVNVVQLLWSHRDYFNRLGLCVPDGWRRYLDDAWGPWHLPQWHLPWSSGQKEKEKKKKKEKL
ncbi:Lipase [Arthrobotrys entomopaga]|nr:Lipase [Arthrobotrys entomopaga]